MKLATIYTPGSYGTFISWCIYSFSNLNRTDNIVSPMDANGSGHRFWGTSGNDTITTTHNWVGKEYDGYILIECDDEKIINYIDNQFQKYYLTDLNKYLNDVFPESANKLRDSWGGTSNWELRELISFFLQDMIDSTKNQIKGHITQAETHNAYKINPENFLLNAEIEVEELFNFFNLTKHKEFHLLKFHVNNYMLQQKNFIKSEQINKFVTNTINNNFYSIENLTIFDEAYIQSKLRMLGQEIRCCNLNIFPTISTELFGLLE